MSTNMERRKFIRYIGTVGAGIVLAPQLVNCSSKQKTIKTKIVGANKNRGHLLRTPIVIPENIETRKIGVLIAGGGISGLSTAYQLNKKNYTDFLVFELNDQIGGNSGNGENSFSKYPLGAHYLTLPNPENHTLIDFLKEAGLITGIQEDGKIIYNEENLCHAPDERLWYRGTFQEGLVPSYGLNQKTSKEIQRFFEHMDAFKNLKGKDGKYIFNIPLQDSSNDVQIPLEFDSITFDSFLKKEGYHSEELLWFLDYCCRDDFGAGFDKVSAWAGINYFAGRKANPANTIPSNVLTWPEGNGKLVELLSKNIKKNIETNALIVQIEDKITHTESVVYYPLSKKFVKYISNHTVVACPSYVAKHIVKSAKNPILSYDYKHHPWLVSSVILKEIPNGNGLDLAWDNVEYKTKGLGYIYNQHQSFKLVQEKYVISVYLAFDKLSPEEERKRMFSMTEEEMKGLVISELKSMHAEIEEHIESIDFQQWGHGMVTPYPGSFKHYLVFKENEINQKRIKLAHTDYAGYSVFEEGFARGINVANEIVLSI